MQKVLYIVDYAYGFEPSTCAIDHVSELRTKKAIQVYRNHPNAYIVLAANMSDVTQGCGSLSSMMRAYLVTHGVPAERILENSKGHNTLSETEAAFEIISQQAPGRIVAVTSAFHALRVRLIWLFRFKKSIRVYKAYHPVEFHERRMEFEKLIDDLDLSLLRRIRDALKSTFRNQSF